jgi:dimethylaniline monooxygenase (N-oxide forming)
MSVVIIGAGQSGLVTCKTFKEKNYNVLVLEKNNKNGLFSNVLEKKYFKWSSSRYISGFSDFPIPKTFPVWMNFKQYCKYLELYKKKNDLDKYIKYDSSVKSVRKDGSKWIIKYNNNNKEYIIYSDFVIVSTGLNSVPKYPNLGNFKGKVIHTDTVYKKMNKTDWKSTFKNKKILLIGGGESALDIGNLILKYTNKLFYTTKTYIEWFPEWALSDKYLNKNKKCNDKIPILINLNTPSDTHLSYLEYGLPTPMSGLWYLSGRKLILNIVSGSKLKCVHNHKKLCEITDTPADLFAKPVIKRTPFICNIHDNKVKVIYYPTKFLENKIVSKDGKFDIDIIVTGTGYKTYIPFLEEKYYKCDLFKKMVPVIDDTIAFVGYVRPTMGSINNISEMQSWWLAEYFKNNLNIRIRNFKWARPRDPLNIGRHIVIGIYYMKDLAMDLDIMPNLTYIFFNDFKLWFKIMHSTIHPALFRIYGKMSIKDGRKLYYDNLPDLKEKKINIPYYIMFVLFHILFLLALHFIALNIYKIVKSKNKKMINYPVIFVILVYICYGTML